MYSSKGIRSQAVNIGTKVTSLSERKSGENVAYLSIATVFHKEIADAKKKNFKS